MPSMCGIAWVGACRANLAASEGTPSGACACASYRVLGRGGIAARLSSWCWPCSGAGIAGPAGCVWHGHLLACSACLHPIVGVLRAVGPADFCVHVFAFGLRRQQALAPRIVRGSGCPQAGLAWPGEFCCQGQQLPAAGGKRPGLFPSSRVRQGAASSVHALAHYVAKPFRRAGSATLSR